MNGVFWLDEYQDAVLSELQKIPWAETTGLYPEIPEGFPTPAVFFDVSSWERSDTEIGGNVTLELTCNIYILRHFVSAGGQDETVQGVTETQVRNAALKMSDWIHDRQFGHGSAPAVLVSAEPMAWEKGDSAPEHAIWGVTFTQRLPVGLDPFYEPDAPLLKEFWLGIFPEVGAAHKDDYILLAKAEEK